MPNGRLSSTVLLLDPDRTRRARLSHLLGSAGWQVRGGDSIADALAVLAERPDAALALVTADRLRACDDEVAAEEARAHFARVGLPVTNAERRGAMIFLTHEECYLVAGRFEPKAMLQQLRDSVASALDEGFVGLRGAGEGSWLP